MGIRLSFILAGVMAMAATVVFLGYRLGDTPAETHRLMGLQADQEGG
jgi:hypothetical protein